MYYAPYVTNTPIALDRETPVIYNPQDLLETFIITSLRGLVDGLGTFQYVYGLLTEMWVMGDEKTTFFRWLQAIMLHDLTFSRTLLVACEAVPARGASLFKATKEMIYECIVELYCWNLI